MNNTENNVRVCDICGCVIEDDDYTEFDGKIFCDDCSADSLIHCEECGVIAYKSDSYYFDDKWWCEDCFNDEVGFCDECGEYHYRDDLEYSEYHDRVVCQRCIDWSYTYCEDCGVLLRVDEAYCDDDGNYYCESCYNDYNYKAIHDYYYKPSPKFYGKNDNMFMGVELEIDKGGEIGPKAQAILDIANSDEEKVYIKHDGSLNDGFEIVSHPMTLDYHLNDMVWKDIMSKAVAMGYRSHDTSTCGLHIHISRDSLGETVSDREYTIANIIYFIELHWNEILKFTRRSEYAMDRWAARYGIIENVSKTYDNAKNKARGSRYVCLNLNNENTIEFRMFRGTLRYETFVATLQLVKLICDICKINTAHDIEIMSWSDFVKKINKEIYPELIEYLKSKELYINEVVNVTEEI